MVWKSHIYFFFEQNPIVLGSRLRRPKYMCVVETPLKMHMDWTRF